MPSQNECNEFNERFNQVHEDMNELKDTVHDHIKRMNKDFTDHLIVERERHETYTRSQHETRTAVEGLTKSTEGLVEAWRTAGGFVKFVKWIAGLVAICVAAWTALHKG